MAAVSQSFDDPDAEGVDRAGVVQLLLEAGADVIARDKNGNTALILCVERADLALLLIKAGADVNARNDKGISALDASNEDVKRVLREHGAVDQDGG
jgi:ankyrin repeat protein